MARYRYKQSFSKTSAPLDDVAGRRRELAVRLATDNLLRAQLRAGQHLLPHAVAIEVGATLGLAPHQIRAATGDPTTSQHGE